ncbi:MAG: phosphoribosylglycinamide formyltransferase [Litorimonas sp.]
MPKRTSTAVLISGTGSNMVALIEAAENADYPADINVVISNRPEAEGLRKADEMGVTAISIDHRDFESRSDFEAELDAALRAHGIEFVVCAGFMRVLGEKFVRAWAGKMINIHPSLLPKYKGLHTHKRAIEAGDTDHGCTVHWVNEGVDEGQIIAQSSLVISPKDSPETLAKRVQALEHELYPGALATALTAH